MTADEIRPTGLGDIRYFPIIFGIIHLIIDASTVTTIFSTRIFHGLNHHHGFMIVLLYDIIAFAGQTPLGMIIDKFRFPKAAAITGIISCFIGVSLIGTEPNVAMAFAAIGNALFHVGAGALSLHVTPGKATAPGIFVGPGAIGLAIGTFVGRGGYMIFWPFMLALAASLVVALIVACPKDIYKHKLKMPDVKWPVMIVILLLTSIVIRSLVGKAGGYEAPKLAMVGFGIAAAAFAGKSIGGIIADRIGWIQASVGALLVSAPLIAFFGDNAILLTIGIFLFQMTMPVTLVATYSLMPGRPGLAFGLNCLAYILGFLPNMFRAAKQYYNQWVFLAVILLSATVVYIALRALKGKIQMKFN